jgi:Uri superfamily endonuclease
MQPASPEAPVVSRLPATRTGGEPAVSPESLPPGCGAYLLLIFLPERRRLRVGALGETVFLPGWYAYVGSAMGGLRARIARHLRREKKVFWHIDHLLAIGELKEVITVETGQSMECPLSRSLAKSLPAGAERFGASDCSCKTHLYFAPAEEKMREDVARALREAGRLSGAEYRKAARIRRPRS